MREMMEVRQATIADASDICRAVRDSITGLCFADHQGDSEVLARWLANKTPDNVERWISNPNNVNLVAVEGDAILAAGCVTVSGEIILNYVSPAARYQGVSSTLLSHMEAAARRHGNHRCTLESTTTARRFYLSRGYRDAEAPSTKHGLTVFPMIKTL